MKWFHTQQLNKKQNNFYRKCTSPSVIFELQYLETYHPAASAALFETFNKTNFSNNLERFHWKEGLSFRCYTVSTARFQLPVSAKVRNVYFHSLAPAHPRTRIICKIWIHIPLWAPAFPRRTLVEAKFLTKTVHKHLVFQKCLYHDQSENMFSLSWVGSKYLIGFSLLALCSPQRDNEEHRILAPSRALQLILHDTNTGQAHIIYLQCG